MASGNLPGIQAPSTSSNNNPDSTTNELQVKVSGVGSLFGLNWGPVTVAVAIGGLHTLAKQAQTDVNAKARLIQIQEEMYAAGLYGSKKPKLGVLTTGEDDIAFRKAMVAAGQSGASASDYLANTAGIAQQTGTAGSGTHIIPAARIQEKVWSPNDILAAINAATTASGEDLAQKLVGREFTAAELQGAADTLNSAQQQQTAADVAGALQQQQSDIATSNAIYGNAPAITQVLGANGAYTPQQVAQAVMAAGGTPVQAQVAGALVTGIESNGQLNDKNPKSTASGLFQFLTTTWQGYGGTAFAPTAGAATLQQQAQVFVAASKHGFSDWAPDLGANWGDNPMAPAQGSRVATAIQANGLTQVTGSATGSSGGQPSAVGGHNHPAPTLKQGRTDQGVDFSGKGNLYPTGAGTIITVSTNDAGWPGGTILALKLDHPVDPLHSVVYYAEDLVPNVKVGQHVMPGQVIAHATGGSSGIEIGFANPQQPTVPLAQSTGGHGGGDQTQAGQDFASWIKTGTISGVAAGGAQGTTTDVYQQPIVDQVPATLDPTAAATTYAETALAPEYQTNNLLKVFQQIESSLKAPPTPNAHVRTTPINMKPMA